MNINWIRNKFDFLANQVKGKIDILMISETELDESFPSTVSLSVLIGMEMAVVFCYILKKIYYPNFYQWIKTKRVFS